MYKYFIFDLDGTLLNTISDLRNSINITFKRLGFPEVTDEKVEASINNGARMLLSRCLPDGVTDEVLNEVKRVYDEVYEENCLIYSKPYEYVEGILSYCKSRGAKMAVYSNKQDACVKKIVNELFPNTFEIALGGGTSLPHKPEPDGALYIAKHLGATPDEIAFIGDSDVDIQTALNAQMHPYGVSWGYRHPDLLTEKGAEGIICDLKGFISICEGKK